MSEIFVRQIADNLGAKIETAGILPDGSGFAVLSIPRKPFIQRLRHYLFDCPTFWQWHRAFTCPLCGGKYRCYWNGHDSDCGAGINLCTSCERKHRGHLPNQCRQPERE